MMNSLNMGGKLVNRIVLVASAAAFLLMGAATNGQGQPDAFTRLVYRSIKARS